MNYDVVAPAFDERYQRNRYAEVRACLQTFLEGSAGTLVEVGCGTGHWLTEFANEWDGTIVGVDNSVGMLEKAHAQAPDALLILAHAAALPLREASVDRLFCVNALHHFGGMRPFLDECRRVLRPGAEMLTIQLDPHQGGDQWWIWDYFPGTRDADLKRYPPSSELRKAMSDVGLRDARTFVAQHFPAEVPYELALRRGMLDRRSTSGFMVIRDDQFAAGMARLEAEKPVLRADLRVWATTAAAPRSAADRGIAVQDRAVIF